MDKKYDTTLYATMVNKQPEGYEGPSPERCLEICNAINGTIAADRIVMADNIQLAGAFPNSGGIYCIRHFGWNLEDRLLYFGLPISAYVLLS